MDQIKIGKFIAAARKAHGMTQKQLAERLLISDKTVSKWERGKGLPEVGLMLPLCEALQITVNDLLSGEKISENNYQKKAEENMMSLMQENQENKKHLALSVICGVITIIAVCALVVIAAYMPIPAAARIALIVLAVATGGSRRWCSGRAGRKSRLLRVPALQGAFCAEHARLCKRVPHLNKTPPDLPRMRQKKHVPPPDRQISFNARYKKTASAAADAVCLFTQYGRLIRISGAKPRPPAAWPWRGAGCPACRQWRCRNS